MSDVLAFFLWMVGLPPQEIPADPNELTTQQDGGGIPIQTNSLGRPR